MELDVFWLEDELFVLLCLPWEIVLLIRGDHLGSIVFVLVFKMDAFALSAGARATETLSSIKVGKVLVLAAQKRLKVYLKKVSRVGMGYDFGKNGLSEGVLLVEPHFLLSEIIILFKVGIFELKIVHSVDSGDSLIQGVGNRVKIDSFILGVIFLLGENFALEDDFLS